MIGSVGIVHQKQPNRSSCLPTSVGMLWGVEVRKIFDTLGHDGMALLPDGNVRSFTLDEMMWLAVIWNKPLRVLNRVSYAGHDESNVFELPTPYNWDVVVNFSVPKVIINDHHAMVYDGRRLYDPSKDQPLDKIIVNHTTCNIVLI